MILIFNDKCNLFNDNFIFLTTTGSFSYDN